MRARLALLALFAACGGAPVALDSGVVDAGETQNVDGQDGGAAGDGGGDSGVPDAGMEDAGTEDAGVTDAGVADAGVADAGARADGGHPGWARYTIAPGSHAATVAQNGAPRLPLAGFTTVSARTYQFRFDATAMYVLTNPVQPDDQLDWNKLPGLSDCGQFDLAADGLMFGWRWRPDLSPPVLELAHYANNGGVHLYPSVPLLSLDETELRAEAPLTYELAITSTDYRFHVTGNIGARVIDVTATWPRRCTSTTTGLKWASGFYFGGTSTAPQRITGWMLE